MSQYDALFDETTLSINKLTISETVSSVRRHADTCMRPDGRYDDTTRLM